MKYKRFVRPDDYLKQLEAERDRDIATGHTHSGPHRDDLSFLCNDHDMKEFASRGEWRSLVLALKFAEMELMRKVLKTTPLLLLDDVFSELDHLRQQYLFEGLEGVQTFVTTTHVEFLEGLDFKKTIYRINEGRGEI